MTYREELKNARRLILGRITELRAYPEIAGWEALGASVAEYIRAEQVEEASLPPIPEFERPNEPLTTLEKELIAEMMRYLDEVSVVIAQSNPREVAKMLARLRGARPI